MMQGRDESRGDIIQCGNHILDLWSVKVGSPFLDDFMCAVNVVMRLCNLTILGKVWYVLWHLRIV